MDSLRLFFEGAASDWDSHQPPNRTELLERALAPFDPYFSACESILEVGTGTGALLPVLSRRYPAARLCSIDLARAMLCQAQKRPGAGAVAQCDVHALPFRNRAFSAVICHNSFPHFHDQLLALEHPAILQVGLPDDGYKADPRYQRQWGWIPGVLHTAVYLGALDPNAVEMGDPATGREQWSNEALKVLWNGTAITLEERGN